MSLPKFNSFNCATASCDGLLTADTVKTVGVRTGCHSFSAAVVCPKCNRLHWPDGGTPVRSRQHDSAYLDSNGDLENRRMPAEEMKKYVEEYIGSLAPDLDATAMVLVQEDLAFIVSKKGHATDCPAQEGRGECQCGIDVAQKWLVDHRGEEIAEAI